MGCYKMPKECDVSGRRDSSPLLNFSERSSNLRPENCPLGSASGGSLPAWECLLQFDQSGLKREQEVGQYQ